jgi:O-antigen/teichoic acid export membrane protein
MTEKRQEPARSATLMVGARLFNMALGLVTLPVLIRSLGGQGFAAWAILLALGAAFSLLELGMAPTVVRFLAVPLQEQNWQLGRLLIGRMWALLAVSFCVGAAVTVLGAGWLAEWVGLPASGRFTAQQAIYFVFAAVAARAFLQSGILTLFAQRRFKAVSVVALLQPVASNVAAMVAAWQSGRLDLTLVSYWSAQLVVMAATFLLTSARSAPRFGRDTLDRARLRELASYAFATQMDGWALFVNLQFDKFIIAGMVGLWAVAPYEVANRAVAALRSIPASGAETFLPTAMVERASAEQTWAWFLSTTRMTIYGVCIFMLAPLAVSPLFLYAWTGEMGYLGRWAFIALCAGAMAGVMALPAATLAQAEGRPGLLARAALFSVVVNVPLSLALITKWGLAGAAIGTAFAMIAGSIVLLLGVHRHFGRPLAPTIRLLAGFWAPLLVCACWAAATYFLFAAWFAGLEPAIRYSRLTRIYPGAIAVAVYGACVATMVLVEWRRHGLSLKERNFLAGLFTRSRA